MLPTLKLQIHLLERPAAIPDVEAHSLIGGIEPAVTLEVAAAAAPADVADLAMIQIAVGTPLQGLGIEIWKSAVVFEISEMNAVIDPFVAAAAAADRMAVLGIEGETAVQTVIDTEIDLALDRVTETTTAAVVIAAVTGVGTVTVTMIALSVPVTPLPLHADTRVVDAQDLAPVAESVPDLDRPVQGDDLDLVGHRVHGASLLLLC